MGYAEKMVNEKTSTKTREMKRHVSAAMIALAVGAAALTTSQLAFAASGTWSATAQDANWIPTTGDTNWSNGLNLFPGATSGTTNADTATFNSASTQTAITINSATLNLKSITFDTSAAAYTIGTTGGNGLLLTSGGAITMNATVANTETVNAPLVIQGAAGTYGFTNNAADNSKLLNIGGGVTGGAAGATVLTLSGSNTGSNTVSGVIGNGTATSVAVTKSGAGTWVLSGDNTYTGLTTISAGTLRLSGNNTNATGGLTLSAGILDVRSTTALGTGNLSLNPTLNGGGTLMNGSGIAITMANTMPITLGGMNFGAAGDTGGNGNITFGTGAVSYSGVFTQTILGTGATFRFNGAVTNTAGNSIFTINGAGNTLVFGGPTFILSQTGAANNGTTFGGSANLTITGVLQNGTNSNSFGYSGTGALTLNGANTYTGSTTFSGGTTTLSGASAALTGTSGITFTGATLVVDDRGVASANANRLNDTAGFTLNNGGIFKYLGSDQASTNSTETIGVVTLKTGTSTISVNYNGSNSAVVTATATASGFTRTATTGGIALINGANLGANVAGSGSVSQFITATAPTLVGTTAGGSTGINSAKQDTKIALFLLGESGTASGANGTATGSANTFLTYNATTGYRPLNPTDEFTNNAITAGTNTYIASGTTTSSSTAAINSLVINGGNLAVSSGTLTDTSGMLLFASNGTISGAGTLTLGGASNQEGIIAVAAGVNGTLSSGLATGTTGLTIYGPGTLTMAGASGYTGTISIASGGTLAIGSDTALGTAKISAAAASGTLKGDGQPRNIPNTLVDTTSGMTIGGSSNLNFTGNGSNPAFTNTTFANTAVVINNTGTTTFSGVFSLNNASSGSNNGSSILTFGSSANVVISGAIQDNNSGNVASPGTGFGTLSFTGVGANFTISGNNGYGTGKTTGIIANAAYNTVTVGGPGGSGATITPFGATTLNVNTSNPLFLVAETNGQILGNNFNSGGSGMGLGFVGSNSMTMGGTWAAGTASSLTNLATGTFTFGAAISGGSLTLNGTGNTTLNSNATLATAAPFNLTATQIGIVTLSNANNFMGATTFNGGRVVLDYSASSAGGGSNRLAQYFGSSNATALTLGGVNLQLSGGSFTQTLGSSQALALTTSGTTSTGATTITLASTTGVVVGTLVTGTGIAANTYIKAVDTGTNVITLSTPTTGNTTNGQALSSFQAGGIANGTTLSAGQSKITQTNSGTSTIALGAIARASNSGGVIDFGTGVATTTTANNSGGILGGYATVNGADWAVANGGASPITALGSYTGMTNGTLSATGNYIFTGATPLTTYTSASQTVNSLKMDASANLTIGSTSLTTGGLLFTGSSSVSITGGAFISGGELMIQNYGTGTLTLASAIGTGSNATSFSGTGTTVLSNAANPYTGATFLNGGVVKISAIGSLGNTTASSITFNGGTLDVTAGGITNVRPVSLGTNGGTIQVDTGTLTFSSTAIISGTTYGGLNKTGAGTLLLQAADTFTGPVTITNGTLQLGNAAALGAASTGSNRSTAPILVNGGTLDINGQTTALGNVTLQSGTIADSAGTGSLAAYSFNLQSGTVGAVLKDLILTGNANSNSINLYKTTSGTVTLNGVNTYTGITKIDGGRLVIGSTGSIANSGSIQVNNGATFEYANTTTALNQVPVLSGTSTFVYNSPVKLASAVTIASGQTLGGSGTLGAVTVSGLLSPGNSPGQMTVDSLLLNSGSTSHMEIGGTTLGTGYDNVTITNSGGLTYGGTLEVVSYSPYVLSAQAGSYTLFSFTGGYNSSEWGNVTVDGLGLTNNSGIWTGSQSGANYSFADSTGILTVTIPEPATATLLFGIASLGMLARRRRQA